MEFFRDSIRHGPAASKEQNADLPFFKIFATFEMSLEEIRQDIDGLNWLISKLPKGEKQNDSDRLSLSVIKSMKDTLTDASLVMRKELGSHVQ